MSRKRRNSHFTKKISRGEKEEDIKIYWFSRHNLSPAQERAIHDLYGDDAEVIHDQTPFADMKDCLRRVSEVVSMPCERNTFAYVVVPAHFAIALVIQNIHFGMFENHPGKRADGQFGLKSVWHTETSHIWDLGENGIVEEMAVTEVWTNPDPEADHGELLVPIRP